MGVVRDFSIKPIAFDRVDVKKENSKLSGDQGGVTINGTSQNCGLFLALSQIASMTLKTFSSRR